MGQSMTGHVVGSSRRLSDRDRPGRLTALRARLHSGALDRDLASGIAPWRSPVHAARALQLTSPRRREACAEWLEWAMAETERPTRSRARSLVIPDRAAVMLCAPIMWEIVATLRAPAPVSAEGMARLQALLCDGAGPLYSRGQREQLYQALEHISRWLPVAT
jgi:hypothetical protein